ncbi:MAG: YheU family protein [Thalassotalea sp.]|nr:YheU family protein [Thalassotalea sp.]MDG2394515.1 YheU family protein [Thalassotalea sp.]
MIIPIEQLDSDTLDNIIQEYILREGTDYGLQECSMEQKIAQIKAQLKTKKIVLVFSELHETINILPFEQFNANE